LLDSEAGHAILPRRNFLPIHKLSFRAAAIRTRNSLPFRSRFPHTPPTSTSANRRFAVNSKAHIFVFSRGNSTGPAYGAAAAQLLEFAPDGKFLAKSATISTAWSFAHSVRVDKEDNIWSPTKAPTWSSSSIRKPRCDVFGRKQEASDEGTEPLKHPSRRCCCRRYVPQVTDMAWDSAGNTYISDGYVNSRVAKADKMRLAKVLGEPRSIGSIQHAPQHRIDAHDNIYVADRGNRRVQVFDTDGKFLRQITIDAPISPSARPAIGNRPTQNTAPCPRCSLDHLHHAASKPGSLHVRRFPGRIYKLSLDGKLLGMFAKRQAAWRVRLGSRNRLPFRNELYVAEILNWQSKSYSRTDPLRRFAVRRSCLSEPEGPSLSRFPDKKTFAASQKVSLSPYLIQYVETNMTISKVPANHRRNRRPPSHYPRWTHASQHPPISTPSSPESKSATTILKRLQTWIHQPPSPQKTAA